MEASVVVEMRRAETAGRTMVAIPGPWGQHPESWRTVGVVPRLAGSGSSHELLETKMVMVRFGPGRFGGVLLAGLLVAAASCGDGGDGMSSGVLATVDGEEVSTERLEKALEASARQTPRDTSSLDVKKDILWKIIDEMVVAAHARKAGYDDDPEVRHLVRQAIVRKYLEDKLQPRLAAVEITEADVESFYDRNRELYISEERVLPAVIYVRKPPGASAQEIAAVRERAEEARTRARKLEPGVANLGVVAEEYSQERKSRERGGEIGWITDGSTPSSVEEALADAAFELEEIGDISEVIETDRMFYVVRLVDRQARRRHELATVRAAIRSQLFRRRQSDVRSEFLGELRKGLEVRMPVDVDSMLENVEVSTANRTKPAVPERRTDETLTERATRRLGTVD